MIWVAICNFHWILWVIWRSDLTQHSWVSKSWIIMWFDESSSFPHNDIGPWARNTLHKNFFFFNWFYFLFNYLFSWCIRDWAAPLEWTSFKTITYLCDSKAFFTPEFACRFFLNPLEIWDWLGHCQEFACFCLFWCVMFDVTNSGYLSGLLLQCLF